MCTYILLNHHLNGKVNEYSQENKGLPMGSKDILRRPRGIILIESTKIRWFSR
jgi:hypothetical protein